MVFCLPLRLATGDCPDSIPQADRTLAIRSLGFRKLSRHCCSLHAVCRSPMDNHPYKLFKLLEKREGPLPPDMGPPCMFDEVAHTFFSRYQNDADELSQEGHAFLESMARCIDVDIAAIEAKHASTRRIATLRGTQTWVPSLDTVNTEWVCRQVSINEQSMSAKPYRQQQTEKKKTRKTPGKQKGARGGGGGGCRAFFHEMHKGRKMTAASILELQKQYAALSPSDKQKYEEIGKAATLSWRHGFKAFADEPARKMFPEEHSGCLSLCNDAVPADAQGHFIRSDGVIVGVAPEAETLAETLVPYRSIDFARDIKKIRSRIYKMAAQARKAFQEKFAV